MASDDRSRSHSPSESEIRADALRSINRFDRFGNEMFDPRALSESGEYEDYGDNYGYDHYEDGFNEGGHDGGYYPGGYHVDQADRDDPPVRNHRGRNRSRSRSRSRPRSRSPPRSRSRSKSSRGKSPPKSSSGTVRVSRDKARRIRKWINTELPKDENKSLRDSVKLDFEGSFNSQGPKIDESMGRQLNHQSQLSRGRGNSSGNLVS